MKNDRKLTKQEKKELDREFFDDLRNAQEKRNELLDFKTQLMIFAGAVLVLFIIFLFENMQ